MSCKYNIDEFKPFTSNKTRIKPAPSDDWRLVNQSLNTNEGVGLYSEKLNTTIYDISFRPFIEFLKRENVTMIGDAIQGEFVIGMSRVLRPVADYNETMKLKDSRDSVHVEKKNYKIGHQYESMCGETVVYIGKRYTQRFREYAPCGTISRFTKLKISYFGVIDKQVQEITARKLLMDEGQKLSEQESENTMHTFYEEHWEYVVFEKNKPINYTIGPIDTPNSITFGKEYTSRYSASYSQSRYMTYEKYYFFQKGDKILISWRYVTSGKLREFESSPNGIIPSEYFIAGGTENVYSRGPYSTGPIYEFDDSEFLQKRLGVILNDNK